MRTSLRKTLSIGFALTAAVLASASAQQQKADVGKLIFDNIPSPDFNSGKAKSFKPKDWLEVEAELTIHPLNAEQKKAGFVDQVTVKWYVAVQDPTGGKGYIKLTKDIVHVNVPVDEAIYTSVYISPNTLKRLTGKDRASKSEVKAVAVEVLVNGTKVGQANNGPDNWWNAPTVSDQTAKYPVLNKNETPFKMLWWDRYAEIEEKR